MSDKDDLVAKWPDSDRLDLTYYQNQRHLFPWCQTANRAKVSACMQAYINKVNWSKQNNKTKCQTHTDMLSVLPPKVNWTFNSAGKLPSNNNPQCTRTIQWKQSTQEHLHLYTVNRNSAKSSLTQHFSPPTKDCHSSPARVFLPGVVAPVRAPIVWRRLSESGTPGLCTSKHSQLVITKNNWTEVEDFNYSIYI